jgi:hypothetical protein
VLNVHRNDCCELGTTTAGRVFLGEIPSSKHYGKKEKHSYKIGTWNVRKLNQGGKLENWKKEMQKNEVSIFGVSEV